MKNVWRYKGRIEPPILTIALCLKKTRSWSRQLKLKSKYRHENLLKEILHTEPGDYVNFLQMDLFHPNIEKDNTVRRKANPTFQRLSIL